MSDNNPYLPPAAQVEDVAAAPAKRVPRVFIALIVIYFLLEGLGIIIEGQPWLAIRLIVLGIAVSRMFKGSRAASRVVAGLFVLGCLLSIVTGLRLWPGNPVEAGITWLVAAMMAAIAAYAMFHPSMKALYDDGDVARWRP
ncbi:hypothetical protein [Piscinibacter terrae]|uniref:Uncharacterized protein n=1 Tax=Piscinibacter terrae TaxID=2496871 RepID=A0A3N7JUD4_9BURK|nr:hypothetical protein [Albitalea terrae]RQP24509.1 hypothetical protein DZC73_14590 [Albitalea terrae]